MCGLWTQLRFPPRWSSLNGMRFPCRHRPAAPFLLLSTARWQRKPPWEWGPIAKGCQRGSSSRLWRGDLQETLSSTASSSKGPSSAQVTAGDKVEGGRPQAGAAVKHFHPFLLGKAQAGFTAPLCVGMGMI